MTLAGSYPTALAKIIAHPAKARVFDMAQSGHGTNKTCARELSRSEANLYQITASVAGPHRNRSCRAYGFILAAAEENRAALQPAPGFLTAPDCNKWLIRSAS